MLTAALDKFKTCLFHVTEGLKTQHKNIQCNQTVIYSRALCFKQASAATPPSGRSTVAAVYSLPSYNAPF